MHIVELINGLIASLHASRYRIEKIDIVESLRVRMPSRCRDLIQRTAFLRWVECNIAMLTQSSNRKQILCRKLHRLGTPHELRFKPRYAKLRLSVQDEPLFLVLKEYLVSDQKEASCLEAAKPTYSPAEPTYYSPSHPTHSPAEPPYSPAEPTYSPADPTYSPADPTYSPADPTYSPAEPTYSPADSTFSPADPSYSPADPSYSPAEPTYSPADPSYSPAEPTYSPAEYSPSDPSFFAKLNSFLLIVCVVALFNQNLSQVSKKNYKNKHIN